MKRFTMKTGFNMLAALVLGVAFLFSGFSGIPYAEASTTGRHVITTPAGVNVRSGPGTNHAIVGSRALGQVITVSANSGSWARIGTGQYVTRDWIAQSTVVSGSRRVNVGAGSVLNIRTGPTTAANVAGTLANNATVNVFERANGFYRISSASANQWVSAQFLVATTTPPAATGFIRPMTSARVTSEFRSASRPNHNGIDIAGAANNTPQIRASAAGVVTQVVSNCAVGNRSCNGGFGNMVIIRHTMNGRRYYTLYAHLSTVRVSVNQQVASNFHIGNQGNTGDSTGPHLHFEVHRDSLWNRVNPRTYINFPALGVWW